MRTDFVVDELGMVHHRANWDALVRQLSPAWRRILGHARPFDPATAFRIPIVADPSMPPNSFEVRSGEQRLRVRWVDPDRELDRWADDGGRVL